MKPLYVRLPVAEAEKLDRAAFERKTPKQRLVADLIAQHLDTGLQLGHHAFTPAQPEVLTLEQAAELLQVDGERIVELAEAGDLPGRRIGEEWRFSRRALLDWLA